MMTAAALVGVGVLAAQAKATAPSASTANTTVNTATTTVTKSGTKPSTDDGLPANSGSGARVVYSPSGHRVWIVKANGTVSQTMQVVPGTIAVPPGSYTVYAKSPGSTGGDGVSVQYVVKFDQNSQTTYGFDAEAGVTGLPPAPTGRTGGIRMAQLDAQALYTFAAVGTSVVVV